MKTKNTCYDRCSGRFKVEPMHANRFLTWCYNPGMGQIATALIFRRKYFSRFYGLANSTRFSKLKIRRFIRRMQVDMSAYLKGIEEFTDFNDFFIRAIDLTKRPVNTDPFTCTAPVDGKILAIQTLPANQSFRIKRSIFSLPTFLRDEKLTALFTGGSMVICRLSTADYHHFHFPDSGFAEPAVTIPGRYDAGGPYSLSKLIPFYSENYRQKTIFHSDHFSTMLIVEIGACTVGSIRQRFQAGVHVEKGSHKGFFELGGSTVVLLFQTDCIQLDLDLCNNTRNEIETYVRLGESIGKGGR
jgi:phosphatidylserine decarboxylase